MIIAMSTTTYGDVNIIQVGATIENQVIELETWINLGTFRISHYCPCAKCNDGYKRTKTGKPYKPYEMVAVDPRVIPLGTKVRINGKVYTAEDIGGAIKGNRIDILVGSCKEAYREGIKWLDVEVFK